ncbi:MAG: response regulator [Gammaproteobacteria bacterium]|nr:response regulator [Gammaproteobacteria bacterium]
MLNVLIVDDSPTEVHFVQSILEKNGFKVSVATNGEDGVQQAGCLQPDLILMDVVMPGMNGFQATRQLHSNGDTSAIPVIMITTKDQHTDKVWGLRQGAVDYIVKPIKEEDLLRRVKASLNN